MNAEELIIYLRDCIEKLNILEFEPIITPTMYDPTEMQNDVTIVVMEDYKEDGKVVGTIQDLRLMLKT